jgi:hypothetical protein
MPAATVTAHPVLRPNGQRAPMMARSAEAVYWLFCSHCGAYLVMAGFLQAGKTLMILPMAIQGGMFSWAAPPPAAAVDPLSPWP